MKRILFIIPVFLIFACGNKQDNPEAFSPDILAQQLFSINTDKDTALQTVHGSIIKIIAGSFNVSGPIQIEIKEAFTPAEIFAAGMATESNGRLLRSAGMIYINASAKGKQAELLKPIKVSIPNQYYDNSMQVFKGIETDSGTVNWVEPVATDTTPQSLNWKHGRILFSKCMSCHSIFKDGTGPAMAGIEKRGPWRDRENVYAFIRNPGKFMAGNRYTQNLKARFGSVMTGFPDLTDFDIDAMLAYIKNEEKRPGAAEDERLYSDSLQKVWATVVADRQNEKDIYREDSDTGLLTINERPCKDDTVYLPVPKSQQTFFNNEVAEQPVTNVTPAQTEPVKAEAMEGLRSGFNDHLSTTGMYDFEIKTLGWYNVDAFVEGYAGTTYVKVWAQLEVDIDIWMHVYLFSPRNKMLSVSNRKENNKYGFVKLNEGVPLFLNDRAILFAFGSKGDKMYYGISEFTIKNEQTIPIRIKESNPEEIKAMLLSKQMEGIDLGIEKKEMQIIQQPCNDNSVVNATDTTAK